MTLLKHQQQGIAIFMAIAILALVTVITITLTTLGRIELRQTSDILTTDQADLYAQSSLAWAKNILSNNIQPFDKKPLTWPQILPATQFENTAGTVSAILEDAQGRFNLNNLENPFYKNAFTQLINIVSPSTSQTKALQLVNAAAAWISRNPRHLDNRYDNIYLNKSPPYRAAHLPMVSISELRLVAGFTPELCLSLEPYLVALPTNTPFNQQHALMPVLHAFGIENPYQGSILPTTTNSEYFLLTTNIQLTNQSLVIYSLLHRTINQDKVSIHIVWQSRGTL